MEITWIVCQECKGTGQVWDSVWGKYFTCTECKGLGKKKV